MFLKNTFLIILISCSLSGCIINEFFSTLAWTKIKNNTQLDVKVTGYYAPIRQPLATMGWEDGIYISRDGLDLYCTYVPGDLLSWTLYSSNPTAFTPYQRGPVFGMDLKTNPIGASSWIHSDILHSHRNLTAGTFQSWELSNMARPVWSEGGVCGTDKSGDMFGLFIYTSNDNDNGDNPQYQTHFRVFTSVSNNPSGTGFLPPSPIYNPNYKMDNPHVERIDAENVVLFFDSDNYPDGTGKLDIWYSVSMDNMASWSAPVNVSAINTTGDEMQPHLYHDSEAARWYLYFTTTNPADGKLAIYRVQQQITGNWDSWGPKELVIGAGNAAAVGEPALTDKGDISFVVIYERDNGGIYDKYEADPWLMVKQ
jgi:hypothetical protein